MPVGTRPPSRPPSRPTADQPQGERTSQQERPPPAAPPSTLAARAREAVRLAKEKGGVLYLGDGILRGLDAAGWVDLIAAARQVRRPLAMVCIGRNGFKMDALPHVCSFIRALKTEAWDLSRNPDLGGGSGGKILAAVASAAAGTRVVNMMHTGQHPELWAADVAGLPASVPPQPGLPKGGDEVSMQSPDGGGIGPAKVTCSPLLAAHYAWVEFGGRPAVPISMAHWRSGGCGLATVTQLAVFDTDEDISAPEPDSDADSDDEPPHGPGTPAAVEVIRQVMGKLPALKTLRIGSGKGWEPVALEEWRHILAARPMKGVGPGFAKSL